MIFISYRRSDTKYVVGLICKELEKHFPKQEIFLDHDCLPFGRPFAEEIKKRLKQSRFALVLIGPQWTTLTDTDTGRSRLENPKDLVRLEVETALATSGVEVIPIWVMGASTTEREKEALPSSIQPLFSNNGLSIRPVPDEDADVRRLILRLKRQSGRAFWKTVRIPPILAAVLMIVVATLPWWSVDRGFLGGGNEKSETFSNPPTTDPTPDAVAVAIRKLAQRVKNSLRHLGEEEVSVGQFVAEPAFVSTSGPGLSKEMGDELVRLGLRVNRSARLCVVGQYRLMEATGPASEHNSLSAQVIAEIVAQSSDPASKPVDEPFVETIDFYTADSVPGVLVDREDPDGARAFSTLYAVTAAVPADGDLNARHRVLADSVRRPKVYLDRSQVRAEPTSPYAVSIIVNGQVRAPIDEGGLAFVKIKAGESYTIRLINESPYDAAVRLSIDGLSLFTFSQSRESNDLIIPANDQCDVLGWYRTNSESDAFLVTEYSKSEAARLLPPAAQTGTITATFAAAWSRDERPPEDETTFVARHGSEATTRGKQLRVRYVEVERHVGFMRSTISIRYSRSPEW